MATFLEIVQKVARESRTFSTVPSAVTSQTGRALFVVNAVIDAWRDIQNEEDQWLWQRKEFSYDLSVDTPKYTAASFNITDFSRWVDDAQSMTIYKTSVGVADESELAFIEWQEWRIKYGRGAQTSNRPTEVAITPQLELAFGPAPDVVYTARGEYYEGAQVLAANGDTPECPARFHDVIAWRALMRLHAVDEAQDQYTRLKEGKHDPMMADLKRDQLPELKIAAAAVLA